MTHREAHTPGPWAATTRQGSWDWVVYKQDDPNIEICQMFHDNTEFNETGEANAHLVAIAPELLSELKKQIDWLKHIKPQIRAPNTVMMGFDQGIKYMSRLVDKATGTYEDKEQL